MRRSSERILTTHVGKLPPDDQLVELMEAHPTGRPMDQTFASRLRDGVLAVVKSQVEAGIDVVNDGELSKLHFHFYLPSRLGGFDLRSPKPGEPAASRRDISEFADFYRDVYQPGSYGWFGRMGGENLARQRVVISGPVTYRGQDIIKQDIVLLREAMVASGAEEGFMTSLPPALPTNKDARTGWSVGGENEYYESDSAFRYAVADALKQEYRAIADAGLLIHIDDPWIVVRWDNMPPGAELRAYRKQEEERVELLNHALEGIPEEMVRYHVCWGSGHGPHAHDLPLKDIVDVVLKIRAQGYSIEAGNGRHEHEWMVWQDVKLPDGKILIPGLVSHVSNTIEHPELVAWRIRLFADLVGKENVIAGTDCGLGGRVHPQIAWAKLRALSDGAKLASQELWRN